MGAICQLIYSGPGNVVAGAAAWWGLRAYNTAAIGSRAVRLRRDSDNAEQDFLTLGSGAVDVASIATFKGSALVYVKTLYDQSGNGRDLVQATTATQPGFLLSGLGSLPVMTFNRSQTILTSATITQSQPFTQSVVCVETGNIGGNAFVLVGSNTSDGILFNSAGTPVVLQGLNNGVPISGPNTADGTWYAIQMISNGSASSLMYVNGSSTALTGFGTTGFVSDQITFGEQTFIGNVAEAGVWYSGFSSGQQSSMNNNQHSYWGF
jgi:hypothetical protein